MWTHIRFCGFADSLRKVLKFFNDTETVCVKFEDDMYWSQGYNLDSSAYVFFGRQSIFRFA